MRLKSLKRWLIKGHFRFLSDLNFKTEKMLKFTRQTNTY